MRDHAQAHFELRPIPGRSVWEVLVTWEHALRDRVQGLTFASEREGIRWIEQQSADWLQPQCRRAPFAFRIHGVAAIRRGQTKQVTKSKARNRSSSRNTKSKVAHDIATVRHALTKLKQRLEHLEIGQK